LRATGSCVHATRAFTTRRYAHLRTRATASELLSTYKPSGLHRSKALSVTSWRDLGEFDEIRVDRISPEDARTVARGGHDLKGTAFLHFGAFFSRAFRENDYLLGRLQAIDRLIDIVCDSAGREALAGVDVEAIRRRAFEDVLRREEPHLVHVPALIRALRAELCSEPDSGQSN
jgi:hypothetical protein